MSSTMIYFYDFYSKLLTEAENEEEFEAFFLPLIDPSNVLFQDDEIISTFVTVKNLNENGQIPWVQIDPYWIDFGATKFKIMI